MDSFNRFSEKKLPNKDDFYIILNDEHISDTQYLHIKYGRHINWRIWENTMTYI